MEVFNYQTTLIIVEEHIWWVVVTMIYKRSNMSQCSN